jgi:hypothetical protein
MLTPVVTIVAERETQTVLLAFLEGAEEINLGVGVCRLGVGGKPVCRKCGEAQGDDF